MLGSSLDASSIADADQRELTLAVARAGERLVALARRVTDPTAQVPNSEWTVRELLAHVAAGADAYARYLEGDATAAVDVSHIAGGSLKATNAALIAAEPEQAPSMLSDRIERRLAAYLRLAAERSLDERVAWHGRQERLGAVMAVLLGELLVHGLDLARATSAPWPLSKRDAAIGLRHASELFPLLLDRRATGALTATVDVRLRQGPTLVVAFRTGELSVGTGPVARADVHVSADPVAFLLVAYGRMSQWRAIATGRLLAWGRRPWLALRLTPVPGPAVTLHRLDGGRCRSAAGPARHRPVMTCIDTFLAAVASGDGIPRHVYAEKVVLDATVPSWRFTAEGADALASTYSTWFADPGRFEELDRRPVADGEVVRYLLTWQEKGVPHAAHHVHLLTTDTSGRITRDTVFCGGRWDAALLAEMAGAIR